MQTVNQIFHKSYKGIQVNYCVSAECENFGNSDPSLYESVENNRNLNIYFCPKCGSYPQIINNKAVYQAVEYQKKYHETTLISCPNEGCTSHELAVHAYPDRYRAFGKTKTLKQRFQCRECSKVFTDRFSGTNPNLELQHAIFYGMKYGQGVRNLCSIEGITPKTFYSLQREMVDRLKYLAHVKETKFYNQPGDCLLSSSYRFVKEATGVMLVASVHNPSGYVLGFDTNLSKNIDKSCLLPFRKKSRKRAALSENKQDLMSDILSGYDRIMSRTNYLDPMSNGENLGRSRSHELTQPYLSSFAHALVMHNKLKGKSRRYYFVEQDTMLRNAFINASLEHLLRKNDQLFYYKESTQKIDWFDNSKLHIRRVGWWKDKWGFVTDSDKTRAACHIKGNNLSNELWSKLILEADLHGVEQYLRKASKFVGSLIHTVNHQSINDWLHVFTAYYNYSLPNKNGKTPAQLMGFIDRPVGLGELLSGQFNYCASREAQ
ncbi:transposase [Vibrio maritimus]|uniref:transposase n=1 Tax=Vibrio maritimus TaxID=990268 RepID=UPI00406874CF